MNHRIQPPPRLGLLLLITLMWLGKLSAQSLNYAFFPPALIQKEGVKTITVYETKIDNPAARAGQGNRIRLARKIVRMMEFDQRGYHVRTVYYKNEGKTVSQELLIAYDDQGNRLTETLKTNHTNNADSTKLLQSQEKQYLYEHQFPSAIITSLISANKRIRIDSTHLDRDARGRVLAERLYEPHAKPLLLLERQWAYSERKAEMVSIVHGNKSNRNIYDLDELGRKSHEVNLAPSDTVPRLETFYSYDPRGWLQEERSEVNWNHSVKAETVVSRKHKYDDHGKLVESQMDYGDGKRLLEFFDHTYWVEKEN